MDAHAVAEAAGIAVGTLNVWIQRGLIPGMTIGSRGRQRDFDLKTAIGIGVIGEFVRFGFDAPLASMALDRVFSYIARPRQRSERLLIARKRILGAPRGHEEYLVFGFHSETELPDHFRKLGERPNTYAVIDLESIRTRMQEAEEQWRQRRKARVAKAND